MSTTIVKQPIGFVTELQFPVSQGEVAVVPAKLGHGDQLKAVRALARSAKTEFEAITKGKAGFNQRDTLQRTAHELQGQNFGTYIGNALGLSIVSIALGCGANALAGEFVGNSVLALSLAASWLTGPAVLGLRVYARFDQAKADKRLVSLDGKLSEALERFQTAAGAEKAMLGATLLTWRDAMNEQKALEPRARAALDAAVVQYNALPEADKARALLYTALDLFLDNPQAMTVDDIRRFRETIASLEGEERREITAACIDIITQSGRTLDYDASYELHLLQVDNEQQRAASSAKEVSAAFEAHRAKSRDVVSAQ